MKFGIMVNEGPYTHQASDTAYQFTKAALDSGHEIYRIFFYHDGVNNGTRYPTPPQDDRHIVNRWSELAEKHDLDLVVCVAVCPLPLIKIPIASDEILFLKKVLLSTSFNK